MQTNDISTESDGLDVDELLELMILGNREPVVFYMPEHGATVEAWCAADHTGSSYRRHWKGEGIRDALAAAVDAMEGAEE